ncbi:MAG: class I SAM-dependent methyltransferase [Anaerolineales bacterium]
MTQIKIYIKSKLYQLVGSTSYRWVNTIITLMLVPIPIFMLFVLLIEKTTENIFFFVLWTIAFYLIIFALFVVYIKAIDKREARSPFYFIKNLHTTGGSNPLSNQLIGAEIGVAYGVNAESILKLLNMQELILIDPWERAINNKTNDNNEKYLFHKSRHEITLAKFSKNSKVKIINDFSIEAAKMFDDHYFDFVYIDGDHSYEAVINDLYAYYPKLKQFGVLCGDDYGHPSGLGVIQAVQEFSKEKQLLVNYREDNQFWMVKTTL